MFLPGPTVAFDVPDRQYTTDDILVADGQTDRQTNATSYHKRYR